MAFQDMPIQRKLMAIILGTSGVVLLLTCATFLTYEFATFKQTSLRQLSTLGEIIATNSTAALAFDNQADATEILGALKAEHHVVAAALYDRQGSLFAQYPANAPVASLPPAPQADGYRFERGRLIGYAPVVQVQGSQRLGTLYLESDMEAMYERFRLYGGIAILVVAGSSIVAYMLSRKLQRQISRPILALAETAQAVSDRREYSVRALKHGNDELGLLTEAFNHMLEQIEARNLELQRAYDDLRQTQQTILQQERLRALGQMASGIAHDINNAISPASIYVETLLEKEPNLSARARDYLTTTQRAIDDVAQTVSRLREFSRQREPQLALAPVDLNQLVGQVVDLTRARWSDMQQQRGWSIEVKTELAESLPLILGVESEIREAMINLIFNAVDAVADGGRISIRTQLFSPGLLAGTPGAVARVGVEVADSGVGMDDETRRRCLEPFFSTKGERGTGLGLAMVYGTMQRHNGDIEIDSTPGQGTTVRLLFPRPTVASELPFPLDLRPHTARPLRLLAVDDDVVLLKSLADSLRSDGHEVVTAGGGREGIDAFLAAQAAGRPFAAVITDLGMPEIDGRKVAAAIKSAAPGTPVFVLTGWGRQLGAEVSIPTQVDRVLGKPPKLRELREALSSVRNPLT
jgi:signal transduction histidine kinase/ActR/RegA family two-component response regulator